MFQPERLRQKNKRTAALNGVKAVLLLNSLNDNYSYSFLIASYHRHGVMKRRCNEKF
jgi:hypothetical protein